MRREPTVEAQIARALTGLRDLRAIAAEARVIHAELQRDLSTLLGDCKPDASGA